MPIPAKIITKDPAATLDYKQDLKALTNGTGTEDWLSPAETLTGHSVIVPSGLTLNSSGRTDTNTSITAWISSGVKDEDYEVVFQWTTSAGRTDERTWLFKVRDR